MAMATAARNPAAVPIVAARKPSLNMWKLERFITTIYTALIKEQGLFKTLSIENTGPQHLYYPGSDAVQPRPRVRSTQSTIFDDDTTEETPEEEVVRRYVMTRGTPEHIRWLWFATMTDRREISTRVYKAHCDIYHDHPEFYSYDIDVPAGTFIPIYAYLQARSRQEVQDWLPA